MSAPVAPAPVLLSAGELAAALAAPRALAKAGTLPHHRTTHLAALHTSALTLRAGNGQQEVHAVLSAEVSGPLAVTVDSERLAAVVAQLDPKAPVRLGRDADGLTLVQGRRRVRLPEVPGEPGELLFPEGRGAWVCVPRARLVALLTAAEAYPLDDETRPHLCGLHLAGLGDWLFVGATDGHRALVARERIDEVGRAGGAEAWSVFLPRAALERWRALLASSKGETCELRVSHGAPAPELEALPSFARLSSGAVRLAPSERAALRVDGVTLSGVTFAVTPAFIGNAPEMHTSGGAHVTARVALAEALRVCKALAVTADSEGKLPAVQVRALDGVLALRSEGGRADGQTEEQLDAMVTCEGELSGEIVAVNVRYLRDALESAAALGTDDADLAWSVQTHKGSPVRSSLWVVRPTGHTLADAPWWVLVMGMNR